MKDKINKLQYIQILAPEQQLPLIWFCLNCPFSPVFTIRKMFPSEKQRTASVGQKCRWVITYLMRGGRHATIISSPSHIHLIFSSFSRIRNFKINTQ